MVDKPNAEFRTTDAHGTTYFIAFIVALVVTGIGLDIGLATMWLPASVLAGLTGLMFLVCMFNRVFGPDDE